MKRYRFGLDVGTNSLGWSVLELDESGVPCAIAAAGSRIFAEGRDSKSKATLAATRRTKRAQRRRRDRFKQRQKFVLLELTQAGLFPKSKEERRELQELNPLSVRARALTERLKPYEVGRALFHLNQRRGFKSNRKDRSEESTGGMVSRSARLLLQQMGLIGPEMAPEKYKKLSREEKKKVRRQEAKARKLAIKKLGDERGLTYGAFLYRRHRQRQPTRSRPGASNDGRLYDVYPTRELYEDEFEKIWHAQSGYHSKIMTENARKRIHRAIFFQRPLKPQRRGRCTYLPAEDRTLRAMPSFQRYRIYQEVNSLEWWDGYKSNKVREYSDAREAIVNLLEGVATKSGQVTFGRLKKELKRLNYAEGDFSFNFETPKRKGFEGNRTSNIMQHEDRVGADWHDWPLEKQDEFVDIILNGTPKQQDRVRKQLEGGGNPSPRDGNKDDDEVRQYLMERFALSNFVSENCLNAPLKDDTAHISCKAARLMLEKMRDGIVNQETGEISLPLQSEAATAVALEVSEFVDPFRSTGDDGKYQLLDKLPYYGEAFRDGRHIISGTANEEDDDKTRWGGVTNPTVHIALNQIRLVVNELIGCFGHPNSIAIELGRELPAGAEQRKRIEKEQRDNQKRNERYDGILREHGQKLNRDNRLRLRLWEELSVDPNGRCCPFSGDKIGIADLVSASTEVEHLIPFSKSRDDGPANKVICTRRANRDKENRTPYEAFGDSPGNYEWDQIVARAEHLPASKRWRFQPDALEIWQQGEGAEFTSRHLNDTRYIGRLSREYLESICLIDRIDVLTGRLTSLLRHHWGLNSLLHECQESYKRKNRDDHRHHAIDAIVVGMTTRSMLHKVTVKAREFEEMEKIGSLPLNGLFPPTNDRNSAIDPWDEFRKEVAEIVRNIVVSHKVKRKKLHQRTLDGSVRRTTDGQLHNETAYGLIEESGKDGMYQVVTRKGIEAFQTLKDIESIRDPRLRHEFRNAFEMAEAGSVGSGAKAVQDLARHKGIRRLRQTETLSVIPIQDAEGTLYKAYKGDSNWGIEIYAFPPGHEKDGKWEGVVISRFEANQKGFKPGETHKPHPAAKMIMRLQINDCLEMGQGVGGERRLFRLQVVSQSGRMSFAELHEANVDSRNRSKEDPFKYLLISPNPLKERNARKVHISPIGKVSHERRRPRRRIA